VVVVPINYFHACCAARVALDDLIEVERQLSQADQLNSHWLLLVKQCLIAVANLTDLERTIRALYKSNPEISSEFKSRKKEFEFAKYVRNKMVGHMEPELIEKAIEWKPELNWLLHDNDEKASVSVNLVILETALNTYVGRDQKHLVFEGDSDLAYPPDWQRFLGWLTAIVRDGIKFLELVVSVAQKQLPTPPDKNSSEAMTLFVKAGNTTFHMITKSR
jgi:hypothetical protein